MICKGEGGIGITLSINNIVSKNTDQPHLQVGDRVVAVNEIHCDDPQAVASILENGDGPFTFTVERREATRAEC